MPADFTITANFVDIPNRRVYPAEVQVRAGRIAAINPLSGSTAASSTMGATAGSSVSGATAGSSSSASATPDTFLLPGFIDAHVHIESSMLVPTEFARAAVIHGTVATVSDPHEIGNVLGVAGVKYMLDNAAQTHFKFYFGAPSCVPATTFETAGAEINVEQVEELLDDPRILYLSEMMNFPGILHGDAGCLAKVAAAHKRNKPVDGHAPGLRGNEAAAYIAAGITTDHECFTKEEALDKLAAGAKITIREGSAARNFDALYTLLGEFPGRTMLCSDDKHPDELVTGHINVLVRSAVGRGIDLYDALTAACIVPIEHYKLDVGQLRVGDPADFIEVDSLTDFNVLRTWINGELVAENGKTTLPRVEPPPANKFHPRTVTAAELAVPAKGKTLRVIEAIDGQLVTNCLSLPVKLLVPPPPSAGEGLGEGANQFVVSDPANDILKLVVVNRYADAPPAVAFIKNFGLKQGAIASSVAHDSHNVIAVGVEDADIAAAINLVMKNQGGLSAACEKEKVALSLPLPIAGLMATGPCPEVATAYTALHDQAIAWGSKLRAPYMTLSFMALLVIPALKLSDLGLFDGDRFQFVELFADSNQT